MGIIKTESVRLDGLFTSRHFFMMAIITFCYFLLSYFLIGFKPEQIYLMSMVNILYFASIKTRKFLIGFSVFIVYWVLFDYMKAFPNYKVNTVHIADLYNFEKNWFGFTDHGKVVTANEFWQQHTTAFLDVITGFFYLTWVPVPLLVAGYLFAKRRYEFFHFSFSFLVINLIGFVIYYVYPAAPPWYVQQQSFVFHPNTLSNAAGLIRFDSFFNVKIFESLYAKGSNVFAAMPSLHSAYPCLVLYYGIRNRLGFVNGLFFMLVLGIWFSAIYTSHHYIADIIAGVCCAVVGIILYNTMARWSHIERFINKMITSTVS